MRIFSSGVVAGLCATYGSQLKEFKRLQLHHAHSISVRKHIPAISFGKVAANWQDGVETRGPLEGHSKIDRESS